jgi:glyoxylase-like metal-dependent hydrolase (beta-lactamase superfamily II)
MYVHEMDDGYVKDLVALIKRGESTSETVKALSENLSALHGNKLNLKLDFLPANPDELNGFEDKIVYFDVDGFLFEHDGVSYSAQHDGGHTKGHVTYQIDRVLFAGDLVSPSNGIFRIEPRMDHKKTGVARGIREIRKATKTALRKVIEYRDTVDYVALGHGGLITIEEFVEKARRLAG